MVVCYVQERLVPTMFCIEVMLPFGFARGSRRVVGHGVLQGVFVPASLHIEPFRTLILPGSNGKMGSGTDLD